MSVGWLHKFRRARLTRNVPLLVTVVLHALAVVLAGAWVVSETIVGATRSFEPPPPASRPVQRQIEHRVQIARRSGAAGAASPVSVERIRSTAAGAMALPDLPALPGAGAGGFGGWGTGLGGGLGAGRATSLGSGGLGGRGLMSMSFLGLTQVDTERVVFVVDVGRSLMDIRKGGFRAFEIIRQEILRLVSQLPPQAEFGVVLFDGNLVNRYAPRLAAATLAEKNAFFAWMRPVNVDPTRLGAHSAERVERWSSAGREARSGGAGYRPSVWAEALEAALELRPETVFLVTGTAGTGTVEVDAAERAQREAAQQRAAAALARQGLTPDAVNQARQAALARAQEQLREINAKLVAQGRDPFVVRSSRRFVEPDFQAAVRAAGHRLEVDLTGWADADGKPIWEAFSRTQSVQRATEEDLQRFLQAVQTSDGRRPAAVNIFLFTGSEERSSTDDALLARTARRHGGRFSLLTSARLDQLASGR